MIVREDRGDVAVLRMERGKVGALDFDLLQALHEAVAGLRPGGTGAGEPRGLVLTGTGTSFSAGLDLSRLAEGSGAYLDRLLPLLHQVILELFTFPRPAVAAGNGHAIAGGFVLACACDYRVVADFGARLGVTELPVGVPFPAAPLEMVRTVLGTARAREVIYSGRLFGPDEAARLGFADELASSDAVVARAVAVAEAWGSMAPTAFELTKRQLQAPTVERLRDHAPAIDAEIAEAWADPAAHAAIGAFVERTLRAP
jgi:enoyl-CoA hydratase